MFGDIVKVDGAYYQVSAFTSRVDSSRDDEVYIENGRVLVRSCDHYNEYRARPLLYHCTDCGR